MTANSSSNHQSADGGGEGDKSPRVRRKPLPSPWAQVVRGDVDPVQAANQQQPPPPQQSTSPPAPATTPEQPSSSPLLQANEVHAAAAVSSEANSSNAASARPKKLAWNKPPPNDGTAASTTDVGPLIGDAVSWPELSKAKLAPKVGPSDSSTPSRTVTGGPNNSQGPAAAPHPPRRRIHSANNPNSNPAPQPPAPARQRPNKHGNGNSSGGAFHPPPVQPPIPPPPPPPPPPFPVFQMARNVYPNVLPPIADPSIREHLPRPISGYPSQPRAVNEHRNSSRRNNFGSHGRGEGQRDRGNYGGNRDANAQSHRANSRSFMRSPPPVASPPPFLRPPPVRAFIPPLHYPEMGSLYYPPVPMDPFRGRMMFPNGPPPLPVFYPVAEPPLPAALRHQIEYYFSDFNLSKDDFLKSKMDNEGWVALSLIASFPRVKTMTDDIQLILNCLNGSTIVEVQDEKVRRRNEWINYVQAPGQVSSNGASASSGSISTSLENMTLAEGEANESSSTTSQPEHPEGENKEDKSARS